MSNKNKYKELGKNIKYLTISNFGSKILSFLLVPLYTSFLTTKEYGDFDIINITISLLVPLLTISISDASVRFLLDKNIQKEDEKSIINVSLKYNIISILLVFIILMLNKIFNIIPIFNQYIVYFILFYLSTAFLQLFQGFARGFNKVNVLSISGIINSIFMFILNILLLVVFKLGIGGYFLSFIIANFISILYLLFKIKISFNFSSKNKDVENYMVKYSRPMLLNSIGWWINNLSDRYIILYMCGASANGIYSVAYKIPSLMTVIQSIFNQAWTISAIQNLDDKEKNEYIINIYRVYSLLMIIVCSLILLSTKILAYLLYRKEFFLAWKYTPFLILSMVFGSLSGILGGIFSAEKKSKIMGRTTLLGAIVNIVLNIVLVYFIGINGAAISTAISFFLVWLIRLFYTKKKLEIDIPIKLDFLSYVILIVQCILILTIKNVILFYLLQGFTFIILIFVNYNEIINIIKKIVLRRIIREKK